jgi:hypothetical protein
MKAERTIISYWIICAFVLLSFVNKSTNYDVVVFYKEPSCHGCHVTLGNYLSQKKNKLRRVTVVLIDSFSNSINKRSALLRAKAYYNKKGMRIRFRFLHAGNGTCESQKEHLRTIYNSSRLMPAMVLKRYGKSDFYPYNTMFNEEGGFTPICKLE